LKEKVVHERMRGDRGSGDDREGANSGIEA
jgi:hypothetical protein